MFFQGNYESVIQSDIQKMPTIHLSVILLKYCLIML
jgi:hypothetical protein